MKKIIAISVLFVGLLGAPAGEAHALGGLLGCGAGAGGALSVANTAASVPVSNIPIETATIAESTKECILDGLVPALREALIATITDNIVSWINSGFEGGPAYVTDLNGFLTQVAHNTALDFIENDPTWGFVCSPFAFDVRAALAVNYQARFRDRISCSLGGVTNNIDGFLAGDFSQGGWPAWFEVSTGFQNNPYGAYLLAQNELNARIASAQGRELQLLNFGSGFFSKGKCSLPSRHVETYELGEVGSETAPPTSTTNTEAGCRQAGGTWEIVTPGSQINEQLGRTLGSGITQLELADEIDEIISALIAQLAQQAFTSLDGLRGLSSGHSSSAIGGGSYLHALVNQSQDGSIVAAKEVITEDINGAIELETTYQQVLDDIIVGYESAQEGFESLYQCSTTANLESLANTASTTIQSGIAPVLADYKNQREASVTTVSQLLAVRGQVELSNSVDTINAAGDAYDAIIGSGVIHTRSDIVALINERDAQNTTFATYDQQISLGFTQCGSGT